MREPSADLAATNEMMLGRCRRFPFSALLRRTLKLVVIRVDAAAPAALKSRGARPLIIAPFVGRGTTARRGRAAARSVDPLNGIDELVHDVAEEARLTILDDHYLGGMNEFGDRCGHHREGSAVRRLA